MVKTTSTSNTTSRPSIFWILWEIVFRSFWILWLGGLTLYIAIVVPVATEVIGAQTQGEVTERVTVYINAFGTAAFLLLLVRSIRIKSRFGIVSALGLLALQCPLFVLHHELAYRMSQDLPKWLDSWDFYTVHRIYLWITTAQWIIGLLVVVAEAIQSSSPDRLTVTSSSTNSLK